MRIAARRTPQTRWHATDTTLGPVWKVVITTAIVVPLLFMITEMRFAPQLPELAFLAVPIGGPGLFAARFLPHLWESSGKRPPKPREGSDDTAT
jgi:hypothetical protein